MEDTLVSPLPVSEPADLSELIRQLQSEVAELRQEVAHLRRENLELRQQVGYWKAQHARAVHRAEHLEAEVEQLRGENRKLQDQLFGRKSEKSSTQDRSNHLEGEEDDRESSTPRKRGQRKDRPGPKRRDYSHLPVIEDPRELPEDQRVCPQCGAPLSPRPTTRIWVYMKQVTFPSLLFPIFTLLPHFTPLAWPAADDRCTSTGTAWRTPD